MSIAPNKSHVTLDELLDSPELAGRFEIVNGQLEEVNVSTLSSYVGGEIHRRLANHCHEHSIGKAFPADTYYQCFGSDQTRSRKPDVSFISSATLPADWQSHKFFTIPPDLAVEVVSPNDTSYEIDQKITDYLEAGVKLVWQINPEVRQAIIHRLDGTLQRLSQHDQLSGESVVPNFTCRLGDIFP